MTPGPFPTPLDLQLLAPLIHAWNEGRITRYAYWLEARALIRDAHPNFSSRETRRLARILAPFKVRDRYGPT